MTDLWTELVGATIAGKYPLEQFLTSDPRGAWYRTRSEVKPGQPAALILARTDEGGDQRLKQWQLAAELDHPHLMRVFETGRTDSAGGTVCYAVLEYPEEDVAGALEDRPLSPEETREVLRALLAALGYLHSRGLVHGRIEPRQIVAVDGAVKFSTSDLRRVGEGPDASPSADIRCLGLCLYEILTQRKNPTGEDLKTLPQPFQEIVRGCLRAHPEGRWTLRQIASALDPGGAQTRSTEAEPPAVQEAPQAVEERPGPARVVTMPAPVVEPGPALWKYVLGAVVVVAIIVWLVRPADQAAKQTQAAPAVPAARAPEPVPAPQTPPEQAAPVTAPPAATPVPSTPEPKQAAQRPKAADSGSGERIWRVVAYTYDRRNDAEKEIARIQRKWPEAGAEVFAPKGDDPPYFVSLGGRMTRAEALQLRRKAWSKGLPRDTFVRNFSR